MAAQDQFAFAGALIDVSCSVSIDGAPDYTQALSQQATVYGSLANAYYGHGLCKVLFIYGLDDNADHIFPPTSQGALFDADYQPKPAYDAVMAELRQLAGT